MKMKANKETKREKIIIEMETFQTRTHTYTYTQSEEIEETPMR